MRNIVALECPRRILKLSGPWNKAVPRMPRKLNIAPYPYRNKFYKINGTIIKGNNRQDYKEIIRQAI